MKKTIINFLATLKNYSILKKGFLIYPFSKKILPILCSLYKEGFIQSFKIINSGFDVKFFILLRYVFQKPIFQDFKILSTPSNPKFISLEEISLLSERRATFFISTTKGILNLTECKQHHLGGKLLFLCV